MGSFVTPAEIRDRIGDRLVIVNVSGGKDSAATSLYLRELGIEHVRVFADTGWEHPKTYEYLRGELTRVLGPIDEVGNPLGFVGVVRAHGMFPSRMRRFCTTDLKIKPLSAYVRAAVEHEGRDAVNAIGIRAQESAARSKAVEWDFSDAFDCDVWRPILSWSEEDVVAIHKRHGLGPNPLYLLGASRVGCWPCINARKSEVRLVADVDPARIDEIEALEAEVTEAAFARLGPDGTRRGMFQARLAEPGDKFPVWPIRQVVAWSKTSRGGAPSRALRGPRRHGLRALGTLRAGPAGGLVVTRVRLPLCTGRAASGTGAVTKRVGEARRLTARTGQGYMVPERLLLQLPEPTLKRGSRDETCKRYGDCLDAHVRAHHRGETPASCPAACRWREPIGERASDFAIGAEGWSS